MLAVLKAGGAYVPLDPRYPAERLRYLVNDSGIRVAIADGAGAAVLPEGLAVLSPEGGEGEESSDLGIAAYSRQAAYVIYTSGSTGQPKGCVISHGNVTRLLAASEERFGFGERDVWTMFHSPAFDFSVWEIWGALLSGGRLAVVPYWVSRSPEAMVGVMRQEGVTVWNQTPSAFRQLLGLGEQQGLPLRVVVFGGEALDFASLGEWFERESSAGVELVNMYGITETT